MQTCIYTWLTITFCKLDGLTNSMSAAAMSILASGRESSSDVFNGVTEYLSMELGVFLLYSRNIPMSD